MYNIHLGVPEMQRFWNDLQNKVKIGKADKNEQKLYSKFGKAMRLISNDPHHPGLKTHEITALSNRYGMKVCQSYPENKTAGAGRIYWVYGPERNDITIIGLAPHPDDKSNSYDKITLSAMGEEIR